MPHPRYSGDGGNNGFYFRGLWWELNKSIYSVYSEWCLVHDKYFVSIHQVHKAISQTFEYLTLTSMALDLGVHLRALLFSSSSGSSFQDLTRCFIACAQAPSIASFLSKTLGLLKGWWSVYWYLMPFSSLDNLLNVKCKPRFLPLAAALVRLERFYLPPLPHCCAAIPTQQVFPKIPSLLVLSNSKMVFSRGPSQKPEVIFDSFPYSLQSNLLVSPKDLSLVSSAITHFTISFLSMTPAIAPQPASLFVPLCFICCVQLEGHIQLQARSCLISAWTLADL